MIIKSYCLEEGNNRTDEFEDVGLDIIGDVHGCFDQLLELLDLLGYDEELSHPDNRKIVFLGDICDRGPKSLDAMRLAYKATKLGHYWIMGNHDNKIFRHLKGNPVQLTHGSNITALHLIGTEFTKMGQELLDTIPYRIIVDDFLYMAHACPMSHVPNICMFGHIMKNGDRTEWWKHIDMKGLFLFGHYWFDEDPILHKNWACLDTSCCDGGTLTALRYPEMEFRSVDGLFP